MAAARYLVTGGAGFIGRHFVQHTLSAEPDCRIVVLDKLTYAGNPANITEFRNDPRFEFVKGDICDAGLVERLISRGVDVVVNFAAETHVDRSIGDAGSFVKTDVYGTFVLLEGVRKAPGCRFLQISTDEVYGEILGEPVDETAPLMPRNPYSASKAGADRLAFSYWATHGVPVCITRCSNNYGSYQYPEKLIPLFVTSAIEGKELPVYGNGKNVRDWIHVHDHARALHAIIRENCFHGEAFNVAGGNERSVLEIADLILGVLGKGPELLRFVKDRPGHDRRYAIDDSRLRVRTGWAPEVDFRDGMRRTIEWYVEHPEWWRPIKSGEFLEYYRANYGL
jgi:dTDP-glucose 4,6-dehydratase